MQLNELDGHKVGMCVSGGLDSKTVTKRLMEEGVDVVCFTADLAQFDIPAVIGMKKKYSTDANLAGLSHEAEDLESLETACTIVDANMGVWPQDAPDEIESLEQKVVVSMKLQEWNF